MIEIKDPKIHISWDDGGWIRSESAENIIVFIQDFFRFFRYIKILEGNPPYPSEWEHVDISVSFQDFIDRNKHLVIKMGEAFVMSFGATMQEMEERISSIKKAAESLNA